jgi:hypothetical protein
MATISSALNGTDLYSLIAIVPSSAPAGSHSFHGNTLPSFASPHAVGLINEVIGPEEGTEIAVRPAESKRPLPRTIHGLKWALAGKSYTNLRKVHIYFLTLETVFAVLSSVFIFSLDQIIVADVQPAIVNYFGAVAKLPWLSVSLLLSVASSNLFY